MFRLQIPSDEPFAEQRHQLSNVNDKAASFSPRPKNAVEIGWKQAFIISVCCLVFSPKEPASIQALANVLLLGMSNASLLPLAVVERNDGHQVITSRNFTPRPFSTDSSVAIGSDTMIGMCQSATRKICKPFVFDVSSANRRTISDLPAYSGRADQFFG
jgi:hypothetical protein